MRLTQILLRNIKVGELTKKYANLPDSYIDRSMRQVYWRTPKERNYLRRTVERKKFYFGLHRPWTNEFRMENMPGTLRSKVFVEPIKEWSVFKGDRVEILVGPDKGKQGIVNRVIQERNWVTVEGLNCELKKMGESKNFPGVYIQQEKPLLVTSEISLVDPSDLESTTIEWRFTEDGNKVRVSLRTGRLIPIPGASEETYDYKSKGLYKESPKDTMDRHVTEITFAPSLSTFEMDIMESMGIKEDRIPNKSYWY